MTGDGPEGASRSATASEPAFHALIDEVADVASIVLDSDGRIATWSAGAEALTGWDEASAAGSHLSMLYPDDGEAIRELQRARRDGRIESEGWRRREDGSEFWAVTTVVALDSDGDDEGFLAVVRDASERRRAEQERTLLATVSDEIAGAETYAGAIETTLEVVCDHTQWAYAEAWTPAEDGDYLAQAAAHAADPELDPFREASRPVTFRAGNGLPGRVWESGSTEWIPDASAVSKTVFHRADYADEVGLRAALGVPIQTDERVVAVLTFFLRERRTTDDRLVEVVTGVAANLGQLLARRETEEALERERALLDRIFETSPIGLLVSDADGEIERANRQAERLLDQSGSGLVDRRLGYVAAPFEDGTGEAAPDETAPVTSAAATGEEVEHVELRLRDDDSEPRWISVSATPILRDDGSVERVVTALDDITERKKREQSLRSFRKAIQQAGHSIYFTDTDGTIEYVNPAFEEITGYTAEEAIGNTPNILSSDEHDEEFFADLWETIQSGEVWTGEVINRRKSGERYVVNQTVAPIFDEAGDIERFVAVNDEITEQKERERELRRQLNSLEWIRQIIESLRPINRKLARVGTRAEIDEVVCEQLTASEAYLFAWVGDYNPATNAITPREWAGISEEFVRELDVTPLEDDDTDELFARAVADREVQALQDIPTDPGAQERRKRAIEYGFQSQAVIPIVYGETVLGVIAVYSARHDAFDGYERGLLGELGERIGHAINAAENKQLLQSSTVIELEFELGDEASPFVAVADRLGCRLSLNNVTPAAEGEYLCYVEVEDASPEAVVDVFADRPQTGRVRVVEAHGDTGLVEVTVKSGPVATLVEHGAMVRTLEADGTTATLLGETAPQADVESIITDIEAADEGTVFVAKRTLDRDVTTLTTTKSAIGEALTDRQREALLLAYHGGYFESPRNSTGEELASALGITPPTFYQHVRSAIQKIVALLVDADTLAPVQK